jgi:hypothetical protein
MEKNGFSQTQLVELRKELDKLRVVSPQDKEAVRKIVNAIITVFGFPLDGRSDILESLKMVNHKSSVSNGHITHAYLVIDTRFPDDVCRTADSTSLFITLGRAHTDEPDQILFQKNTTVRSQETSCLLKFGGITFYGGKLSMTERNKKILQWEITPGMDVVTSLETNHVLSVEKLISHLLDPAEIGKPVRKNNLLQKITAS